MNIKEKFRQETGKSLYADNSKEIGYSTDYVNWIEKQLRIGGVSLSAYMVVCEPDGKRLAVIAESIGDACDKLDEQGFFDYQFVRSVSFDVLH